MDRAWKSNASATPPTTPISFAVGYPRPHDSASGLRATEPGAYWFHMVTEEMRNLVVAGGGDPSATDLGQLAAAVAQIVEDGLDERLNTDTPASAAALASALFDKLGVNNGPGRVGFNPTLNYAAGTLGRHVADEFWNVCDFPWLAPRDGSGDATGAIQACINAATAAGAGVFIPGTVRRFRVNNLVFPAKCHIRGAGHEKSVLEQISGADALAHLADPGSATAFTSGVTIQKVKFQGTVAADGFQEVLHLLFTQGASDLLIQECKFSGFRGDGLYIGTGNERGQNPSQVRHNRNVRVLDCVFDGETKDNRNGISVIDCSGLWVERCFFTRCSRSNMPGCIDIEPDGGGSPAGTAAIIRDINIIANRFRDNAGQAAIAVNFPNSLSLQTVPVHAIKLIANEIDNEETYTTATYGIGISVNGTANVSRAIPDLGITAFANTVRNMFSPFLIKAARGVRLMGNDFGPTLYAGEIGDPSGATVVLDVVVDKNTITRVSSGATTGANGVILYAGMQNVSLCGNTFDSCGNPSNGYNVNICMKAGTSTGGTKTDITVEDNTFISPVPNSNCWDVLVESGGFTPGTSRHARNRLINVNGGTVGFFHDYTPRDDIRAPGLTNGWQAFGGNYQEPRYWKDSAGLVHVTATIKGGSVTNGDTIHGLPPGYRPGKIMPFVVYTSAGPGSVQVEHTIGDIQVLNLPTNTLVSFHLIFKAEA